MEYKVIQQVSADKRYRNFLPWFGLIILVMGDYTRSPLQGALTKSRRQRSQARVRHGRSRLTDLLCAQATALLCSLTSDSS